MFRKRSFHKPAEAFYVDFKKNYSYLGQASEAPVTPAQTLDNSLGMSLSTSQYINQESHEHAIDSALDWKLDAPGYMGDDAYDSYAGYWPPTPGIGGGSAYHSGEDAFHNTQPSSLGMSTGTETPTSRSMTSAAFHGPHSGSLTMNDVLPSEYHPSALFGNHYQNYHLDRFQANSYQQTNNSMDMHDQQSTILDQQIAHINQTYNAPASEQASRFRFRVTLQTATAMVKSAEEIPLTYLNKCQTYKLSIKDTAPQHTMDNVTRYRTYIRISFDDEQQREKPGHCWQLWKEGRGMNEAHQRGGKLQAVEYVPAGQSHSPGRGSNLEVLSEAFDGFCISWNPVNPATPECEIQVRFNFLSTDFSHSKGVKGIPVRLCAKTELLRSPGPAAAMESESEVCYCKVKLFRDHGAERKIANDEAHVKKNIEKLSQQISQAQTTIMEGGKRRRSDSMTGNPRPSKLAKHKRASSVSSVSTSGGAKDTMEDDLHGKLAVLGSMLRSRKSDSLLFLEGDEQDDPDLFPATLQGLPQDESSISSPEIQRLERRSTQMTGTSGGSPTLSVASVTSPRQRPAALQCPTPSSRTPTKSSNEITFTALPAPKADTTKNPQHLASPPDGPIKVEKSEGDDAGATGAWIEAMGVDDSYKAPVQKIKPAACFYIMPTIDGEQPKDVHYRAIYLRRRTLKEFVDAVARKCNIDATLVSEVVHINSRGLSIKVDDEVLLELPEGQDMQVDLGIKTTPEDFVEKAEESKPGMSYLLTLRY